MQLSKKKEEDTLKHFFELELTIANLYEKQAHARSSLGKEAMYSHPFHVSVKLDYSHVDGNDVL